MDTSASPSDAYDYEANCRQWPAPGGAFPVGTLEFEVTDPLRSSHYAAVPTPSRRLYVRAWYPARDTTGCSRRPYFTEREAEVVPAMSLRLLGQPPNAFRGAARLLTNAYVGAPPALGKFPVVVFNHGYLSYPAQHTALFEHLVAHGFVVLSVGHPWESGGITYPNGDVLLGSPRILQDMMHIGQALGAMAAYAAPTLKAQLRALREYIKILRTTSAGMLASVWRDDVYFILDQLEDDAVPGVEPLAAILDHDRRVYMGKSFGAYVAGMLAQGDPRARAVVHLDGGVWSYELVDCELRSPFLTISSDLWDPYRTLPELPNGMDENVRAPLGPHTTTGSDLAYEVLARAGLRDDGYRYIIPGIRHSGVSDLPELAGVPAFRAKLGIERALAAFTAIQNALVRGFLDQHVRDAWTDFATSIRASYPDLVAQDLSWLRERVRSEFT